MFKQIILPILAVIVFIVLVGLFVQKSPNLDLSGFIGQDVSSQKTIKIADKELKVEVVRTNDAREKGLSGKSSMEENSGMLFVFDTQDVTPTFWMKGMLLSIDIIWINDGKIIKIDKNAEVPKPSLTDDKLKTYSAGRPVDYVLEVSAGYSDKNNLKVGDVVDLSGI